MTNNQLKPKWCWCLVMLYRITQLKSIFFGGGALNVINFLNEQINYDIWYVGWAIFGAGSLCCTLYYCCNFKWISRNCNDIAWTFF